MMPPCDAPGPPHALTAPWLVLVIPAAGSGRRVWWRFCSAQCVLVGLEPALGASLSYGAAVEEAEEHLPW